MNFKSLKVTDLDELERPVSNGGLNDLTSLDPVFHWDITGM